MKKYSDILFGEASAELEAAKSPELLIRGFLDNRNVQKTLVNDHKFLVLGHKGSGKSAIAEKLNLISETESFFAKKIHLGDFPFKPFSKIMSGDSEAESKYPTSWSWILLLTLIDSLYRDQSIEHDAELTFLKAVDALQNGGLLPADNIKKLGLPLNLWVKTND